MEFTRFAYMRWAKETFKSARINLGASEIERPDPAVIGLDDWAIDLRTNAGFGDWDALIAAIADREGVDPDRVFACPGASYGLYLSVAAMFGAGDEVLVETPGYEALERVVEAVGATPKPVARRPENGYRLDPKAIAAAISPRTRGLIFTNLHNPTGARVTHEEMREILRVTQPHDIFVVASELYRDYDAQGKEPPLATLSDRVVSLFSLTKVYGLGPLRAGWIIGAPDVVERLDLFNDHILVVMPGPTIEMMRRILPRLDELDRRTRAHVDLVLPEVDAFIERRDDLEWVRPVGTIYGFPRVTRPGFRAKSFADDLLRTDRVVIVPGEFFGDSSAFRLGFGAPLETVREGLECLGRALERSRAG